MLAFFIAVCSIFSTNLSVVQASYNTGVYIILCISISIYGWKLKQLYIQKAKIPFLKNARVLLIFTLFLVVIFFTRALWDCLLAIELMNPKLHLLPVIEYGCPCPKLIDEIIVSLLLFLWEIVPSIMMLGIFRKIPKVKKKPAIRQAPNQFISYWTIDKGGSSFISGDLPKLTNEESRLLSSNPSPLINLGGYPSSQEKEKNEL